MAEVERFKLPRKPHYVTETYLVDNRRNSDEVRLRFTENGGRGPKYTVDFEVTDEDGDDFCPALRLSERLEIRMCQNFDSLAEARAALAAVYAKLSGHYA